MNLRAKLRAAALGVVLCAGSLLGVPMRPEEVEDLMASVSRPKIEVTVEEKETPDEMIRRALEAVE